MNNTARFIKDKLKIIDKQSKIVDFALNPIQEKYILEDQSHKDLILKARQQGFSSVILAQFTKDFLLKPNSLSVVVADISDNARDLLARVKFYLESYAESSGFNLKEILKYNSKYELENAYNRARYIIGTANNSQFGRSKTITNLHLSEFAFYPNPEELLAGAMQAVVPDGRVVIETTANGFNYFKDFWDRSELGETSFTPLFYRASDFYDAAFLAQKRKELKRTFPQEYPETPLEAFIASGDYYFDKEALEYYYQNV